MQTKDAKRQTMRCPEFERLIDHLDGRLEGAETETVQVHLASGCAPCISDRAWYDSVRRVIAADDSIAPPPWVFNRAIRVPESARSYSAPSARFIHLVAVLIYDSLGGPSQAGARTMGWLDHQLLYRADDFNIDLLLVPSGDRVNLRGQVMREGEFRFESTAAISLDLIGKGRRVHGTRTNQAGEFTISAIESGGYDLCIEAGEASITIAGLSI